MVPQWSTQLGNWTTPSITYERINVSPQTGGMVSETWRSTTPLPLQSNAFFRLKIMSLP